MQTTMSKISHVISVTYSVFSEGYERLLPWVIAVPVVGAAIYAVV